MIWQRSSLVHTVRPLVVFAVAVGVLTAIAVGTVAVRPATAATSGGESRWIAGPTALSIPSGESNLQLTNVSCTATTSCVAVGNAGSAGDVPIAETLTGSSWTAAELPIPSGQAGVRLTDISCSASTSCVAVGTVGNTGSASPIPIAETLFGTTWTVADLANS